MTQEDLQRQAGSQLQLLRKVAGLTQEELARKLGVSTSYVIGVEHGRKNVTLAQLYKIAQACKGQVSIAVKL